MKKTILTLFLCFNLTACNEAWQKFASEFQTQFNQEFTIPKIDKCIEDKRDEADEQHRKSNEYAKKARKEKNYKKKADYTHQRANHLAMSGAARLAGAECADMGYQLTKEPSFKAIAETERVVGQISLDTAEQLAVTAGNFDNAQRNEDFYNEYKQD